MLHLHNICVAKMFALRANTHSSPSLSFCMRLILFGLNWAGWTENGVSIHLPPPPFTTQNLIPVTLSRDFSSVNTPNLTQSPILPIIFTFRFSPSSPFAPSLDSTNRNIKYISLHITCRDESGSVYEIHHKTNCNFMANFMLLYVV